MTQQIAFDHSYEDEDIQCSGDIDVDSNNGSDVDVGDVTDRRCLLI